MKKAPSGSLATFQHFLITLIIFAAMIGAAGAEAFIVSDLNRAGRSTAVDFAWWMEGDEIRRALYVNGFSPSTYQGDEEAVSVSDFIQRYKIFSPQAVLALSSGKQPAANLRVGIEAAQQLIAKLESSGEEAGLAVFRELLQIQKTRLIHTSNHEAQLAEGKFVSFLTSLMDGEKHEIYSSDTNDSTFHFIKDAPIHFQGLLAMQPTRCLREDPRQRFISTERGCKDNHTGLIYSGSMTGISPLDIGYWTRSAAQAYCRRRDRGKSVGWRLPTTNELAEFVASYGSHFVKVLPDGYYWSSEELRRKEELVSQYESKDQKIGQYEVLVDTGWGFRRNVLTPRLGTLTHQLNVDFDVDVEKLVHLESGKILELKRHTLRSAKETISVAPNEEGPRRWPQTNGKLDLDSGPRHLVGPGYKGEIKENLVWGLRELPGDVRLNLIGLMCVLEDK